MRQAEKTPIFMIALTILIGVILTIMPLPMWAIWLRPQWLFAIVIFWVVVSPSQCGIILAFFTGLLMDLVTGTPIGEHAAVFVLLTYLVLKLHTAIVHFPMVQQAGIIIFLAALSAFFQTWILSFSGHSTHMGWYTLSAITTGIIWPWLFAILNRLRPKAAIY